MKIRLVVLVLCAMCVFSVQAFAGFEEGRIAYDAKDYATALQEWLPLAKAGDASAQFNIARMHYGGEGVPQDKAEAVEWYRLAADQGSTGAQFNLGLMYDDGESVSKNKENAAKWYLKAASHGLMLAQLRIGIMYDNGEGIVQNKIEAGKWYRKAADQGQAAAQYLLGYLYANGEGVAKDKTEAVKWFRKSADQGDADAQFNLGIIYDSREGVTRDAYEAGKWYLKAAKQGHTGAQNNLGLMYIDGDFSGVKNEVKALRWFTIAARNGDKTAQSNFDKYSSTVPPAELAMAKAQAMAFRTELQKKDVKESAIWLKNYRAAFANVRSLEDYVIFFTSYCDDDPEGLAEKAMSKYSKLKETEEKKKEAAEKKQRAALDLKQKQFRAKLKVGADTHCGMVIAVNRPVIKIQTMIGEKWFKIGQLYAPGSAQCRFYNGEYVEP